MTDFNLEQTLTIQDDSDPPLPPPKKKKKLLPSLHWHDMRVMQKIGVGTMIQTI